MRFLGVLSGMEILCKGLGLDDTETRRADALSSEHPGGQGQSTILQPIWTQTSPEASWDSTGSPLCP